MDQNRCLLDVIDNPQLLQSFLESEPSPGTAPTTTTSNICQQQITAVTTTTSASNYTSSILPNDSAPVLAYYNNTTTTTSSGQSSYYTNRTNQQQELKDDPSSSNFRESSPVIDSLHDSYLDINNLTNFNSTNSNTTENTADPIVSVLDSIITETVAETSPSNQNVPNTPAAAATPTQQIIEFNNNGIPTTAATDRLSENPDSVVDTAIDNVAHHGISTVNKQTSVADPSNINSITTQGLSTTGSLFDSNDTNNNSTSSSDDGSSNLLVDEYFTQQSQAKLNNTSSLNPHRSSPLQQQQPQIEIKNSSQNSSSSTTAIFNNDNSTISGSTTTNEPSTNSYDPQTQVNIRQDQQPNQFQSGVHPTNPPVQLSLQPLAQQQIQSSQDKKSSPTCNPPPGVKTEPTSNNASTAKPAPNNNVTSKTPGAPGKTPETKPKRSRAKKNTTKVSNASTTPSQSPATTVVNQIRPMQTQFASPQPNQQQIVFQTNNGIRQPTMMATSPMGQPMTGVPQQQRVIQIQTANGPMYFAIAPGPAAPMNNNSMMNQQQIGMQSHQYPSQQVSFQPNSSVMINRPQLPQQSTQQSQQQTHPQQQQQHQQQQPSQHHPQQPQQQHQIITSQSGNMVINAPQMIQTSNGPRIAAPMMSGQTIAMANQQNPQQQGQHVVLPSSQQMMMPRMSNQIVLNRPMGMAGQLMPGQQQFIQILTPNGPMLLALPTQQAQPMNNNSMDYNNQAQSTGQQPRFQMQTQQQSQPQQVKLQSKASDSVDGLSKQVNVSKNAPDSKAGLDLADLLLDCGILPDERTGSQSVNSVTSQSPSLSQISSPMPSIPQQISSPMPNSSEPSNSIPTSLPTHQPMTSFAGQPGGMQQQPVRITFGPDGQMIMQPAMYGAIRPVLANSPMASNQMSSIGPSHLLPSSPMMTMTATTPSHSTPSNPNSQTNQASDGSKKTNTKGKGTAVKRSRSKKSDIDKFPQLKTPKIAQQQQKQQQQQQQQLQAITVVPMTMLVNDQNKIIGSSSDAKPNVSQLVSGQQVSVAKFVSPVMQQSPLTSSLPSSANSNMVQTSLATTSMIATNQHQKLVQNQQLTQVISSGQMINTQRAIDSNSVNSISPSNIQQENPTPPTTTMGVTAIATSSASQQLSSSDTLKIEQNGLKQSIPEGHQPAPRIAGLPITQPTIKAIQIQNADGNITTLVLQPATQINKPLQPQQQQQQQQTQAQLQQQQLQRKLELRAQSILNQLAADQNAALNPQTKESFKSIEDACKRLLRYHVFDTETVGEDKIRKVDEIFEAAVESLISRKQAIYDKFRFLILKQSMRTVPLSEEIMMEQVYINDELAFLKKERELFRDYEAHLENIALNQAKADSKLDMKKDDCAPDYFAFGNNSPKPNNHQDHDLDNAAHSRDVDDSWMLADKWGESRYPSVPDSEAATAIESILNEEIS